MNANVIIYYRVSSNEQTLGASLDVQEERLRKYCNQMGYNIIDNIPYREDESAKTFEKRPVIQGIMNYIRKNKGRVNKLLFLQWDRYSRDIISASENLKELLKSGVEPNAIEAPLDFNSDTWPLLLEYRHNATTSKGQKIQWTVFMEHWQKENVLIKHQEGYKNIRVLLCMLAHVFCQCRIYYATFQEMNFQVYYILFLQIFYGYSKVFQYL